jgi:hypothetical protein
MIDIESAVRLLLLQSASVLAKFQGQLIGDQSQSGVRIYPDALEQGCDLPAVVFQEISDIHATTTDGPGIETCRIQFDCYDLTRAGAFKALGTIHDVLCPRLNIGQVGFARYITLSDGTVINIQAVIPGVRISNYENATKLYRRGRDYKVTASAA